MMVDLIASNISAPRVPSLYYFSPSAPISYFGAFLFVLDDDHLDDLMVFNGKKVIEVSGIRRLAFIVIAIRKSGNELIET
jgi:hypothetical protein